MTIRDPTRRDDENERLRRDPTRQGLQEENQKLRETLAEFGVHREARKPGETLQEENRRLHDDVRWYQGLLKDA